MDTQLPHELSKTEIHDVQAAFAAAAGRALAAGFEWLEIHAAHGYLIHSFYSPFSNQRTDEYGGSFENRIRFLIETVRAVRQVWPERLPLTVRLPAQTGWKAAGRRRIRWTLACRLKEEGVDLIDCSSGGNALHSARPAGSRVPGAAFRSGARGRHPDRRGGPDHRARPGR